MVWACVVCALCVCETKKFFTNARLKKKFGASAVDGTEKERSVWS